MTKLKKIVPAWHLEAARELNKDFAEVSALDMTARKRRAYLGLKFHYVKERGKLDGSIPHGQFEGWMQENCPAIPERTANRYMAEGKSVCERMGWQIRQIGGFEIPPHKLLELATKDLPAKEHKAQQLLLDLVESRGKFEPFTEYKQVDEHGMPKRGQQKGSKGLTKEMREKAANRSEEERLNECEDEINDLIERLLARADAKNLGAMDSKLIKRACDAADTFSGFGKRTLASRNE